MCRTSCSRTVSTCFVITRESHDVRERVAGSEWQFEALETAQFLTLLPGSACYFYLSTPQSREASPVTYVLLHSAAILLYKYFVIGT